MVEKECLAIHWAVDSLHYYLLRCPFTLYSDHALLQWPYRIKDANARINQWYLPLQPFKFKVAHRLGCRYWQPISSPAVGSGGSAREAGTLMMLCYHASYFTNTRTWRKERAELET